MKGFRGLSIALVVTALFASAADAQQKPRDTKYTKDAAKFLGLAMMRPDPAERQKMYQDALIALQEGFEKDAQNPKFWFTAGQAYAGLGQTDKAAEAFNKAVELYPEYAEEVEGEKEQAWMAGFERGVQLMDEQKMDSALLIFEAANAMYPHRPEAWLNVGSIYANRGETDRAVQAFEKALEAIRGPMFEKLDSAGQASWKSFEEMSSVNIAQMRGAQGVEKFEAEQFKEAEELFRKAAEMNPHSRDFLFNIVQSKYAQATKLDEQITADASAAATVGPELIGIYESVQQDIKKVQEYDPANETLYQIAARSAKRAGELKGDSAAGQQGALALLTELHNLPVDVSDIAIQPGDENTTATINGTIKNRNLAAGAPVKLKFTLLDRQGATIGEQEVTVNAPEKDQTAPFTATTQTTAQVAGWKYQIVP
jgi:tetratricopeptide (TPR) repeat protein